MPIDFTFAYTDQGVPQIEILVCGPQKSGKSYLISHFVPLLGVPKEHLRVVGPPSASFIAQSLGVPWTEVSTTDKKQQEEVFRKLMQDPMHILAIIDEMDTLMGMSGRNYGSVALRDYINTGRSLGKSYIGVTHAPAGIGTNARQNADIIFFSRSAETSVMDYASRLMYLEIDDPQKLISSLPKYLFLVWEPNGNPKFRGFAKVQDNEFLTFTPEEIYTWKEDAKDAEPISKPENTPTTVNATTGNTVESKSDLPLDDTESKK